MKAYTKGLKRIDEATYWGSLYVYLIDRASKTHCRRLVKLYSEGMNYNASKIREARALSKLKQFTSHKTNCQTVK